MKAETRKDGESAHREAGNAIADVLSRRECSNAEGHVSVLTALQQRYALLEKTMHHGVIGSD